MSRKLNAPERRCGYCTALMPRGRVGRKYCTATCRFKAWRAAHHVAQNACAYCGSRADTVDHVPARAVRPYLAEHAPGVYPELEVPACRECNTAIGAKGFTLASRRVIARRAIERRYRDVLAAPAWSAEELAEMGPGLDAYIAESQKLKAWVLARLGWNR